jgi:protein-arginine kinase activator protein McsA
MITYRIASTGEPSITCLRCGMTSFNVNDIAALYCAKCHAFHEALPVMPAWIIDYGSSERKL